MEPVAGSAGAGLGLLKALKEFPLWLFAAIAIAVNIFLLVPTLSADLSKEARPWIVFAAVLFTVLAIVRAITIAIQWLHSFRAAMRAGHTLHFTPIKHQCYWAASRQSDDSVVTQLVANFVVKNLGSAPLGLVSARVVKPRIEGEVIQDIVYVRALKGKEYGSAVVSGHTVPPGVTLPVNVVCHIRGRPNAQDGETLNATFGIADDEGKEHRVKADLRGMTSPSSRPVETIPLEAPFKISDPLEKELVSLLQFEISRYEKCGRGVGGLGSVHIVYQGHAMRGVGTDSWETNSPKNQSVVGNPDAAALQSDNLEALTAMYGRLTSDTDRTRFVQVLLDRLGVEKGYLRVSYFIVCSLWKLGNLTEALRTARKSLPQGEIKEFGLSNVLMLLNGLLRYRYPDFTNKMLDEIEGFIHGMTEHPFMIAEKIAAIRANRLVRA